MMQRFFFQIRDFKIAESEADISYYAGYVGKIIFIISFIFEVFIIRCSGSLMMNDNVVGSSFMLGRTLTSVLWGMVSDRYGRKPVMVIGVFAV